MKSAIYYTLVTGWSPKCCYRVMAVTSEKPGKMIYGRDDNGVATHRSWHDRYGRFETEEAAAAVIDKIVAIHDQYAEQLRAAQQAVKAIDFAERDAVLRVLRDAGAVRL